jgi:CRISPR type I-E-associated protein CasB/Cse2
MNTILAEITEGTPDQRRPRVLEQLSHASQTASLSRILLRIRGVGISYGTQRAIIDETYHDELSMPATLFAEHATAWRQTARDAVGTVEHAAQALNAFVDSLAQAAGAAPNAGARAVGERLYTALDRPFRQWLMILGETDITPSKQAHSWTTMVHSHADAIANDVVRRAPAAALRGRVTSQGGGHWTSAASAELGYRSTRQPIGFLGPMASPAHGRTRYNDEWAAQLRNVLAVLWRDSKRLAGCRRHGAGNPAAASPQMRADITRILDHVPERADERAHVQDAIGYVLSLFSLHQQSQTRSMHHSGGLSIGAACRSATTQRTLFGMHRRFHAALAAASVGELVEHLRAIVMMLRNASVALDYVRLAEEIARWPVIEHRQQVQRQWGWDFLADNVDHNNPARTPTPAPPAQPRKATQ